MSAQFKIDPDYNDVPGRIAEFRAKHPEGSLQQVKYEIVTVGAQAYLIYTAAAYRTQDDPRPGHGTAWEPIPGKTPYTKDSEMQNAETSAWGRAIVAVLASDTKKGIATTEDIRNRQNPPAPDPRDDVPPEHQPKKSPLRIAQDALMGASRKVQPDLNEDDRKAYVRAALESRGLDPNTIDDVTTLAREWSKP